MTLSDLASLGSFVSGVAVLISLIYLAIQVRQAEKNQRAMINESYVTRVAEHLRWSAEPVNIQLLTRAISGETAFTAEEINSLSIIFRVAILSAQAVFQQNAAGLIDRNSYDSATLAFKVAYLPHPVFRALWARSALVLSPEFRAVVEAMLRETPIAPPADIVARFNEDLARMSAGMPGGTGEGQASTIT
ncbi:MAG TPA: hypothetical protein VJ476_05125 [Rhizomicrobium sp.]|nr:hypothetical protein [Rhizomicrobium sp.]